MIKVFIASPYTYGDINDNMQAQKYTANALLDNGFNPLPIALYYHNLGNERDYQLWIDLTLEWVPKCDCLLRLPGKSFGADGEVKKAVELGLPVFYSIDEVIKYYKN